MSTFIGASLPEELLHAILRRLCKLYVGAPVCGEPKRGLASCSQTCRYWAKLARPVLFYCITLRSAEDVSTLLAFLSVPDFLGCSIKSCLRFLHIEEDRAASSIPWGHNIKLRLFHALKAWDFSWKIKGAPTTPKQLLSLQQGRASLPVSLLPRTTPSMYSIPLERLILCNAQLPSADALAAMKRYTGVRSLELDQVTLPAGYQTAQASLRALHRRWGIPLKIDVLSSIADIAHLPSWIRVCNLLVTSQQWPLVDTEFEALVVTYLQHIESLHVTQGGSIHLTVEYSDVKPNHEKGRHYQYTLWCGPVEESIMITELRMEHDTPNDTPPQLKDLVWRCPSADETDTLAVLRQFEDTVLETFVTIIPPIILEREDDAFARVVVRGVLEERALTALSACPSMVTATIRTANLRVTLEEVFAAPTHCGDDNERVPLTTDQRAEWALCGGPAQRDAYLNKLSIGSSHTQLVPTMTHADTEENQGVDKAAKSQIPLSLWEMINNYEEFD